MELFYFWLNPKKYVYSRAGVNRWSRLSRRLRVNAKCAKCKSTTSLHVHHIYPRNQYPTKAYKLNNLIVLCEDCHIGDVDSYHRRNGWECIKCMDTLKRWLRE